MPRLFAGIEIPPDIAARLSMLQGGLLGARWIDPENYHLTLRFAGDIDDRTAQEFASALALIRLPPFELSLDGLGSFGNRKPRALWAGVDRHERLTELRRACDRAAAAARLPNDPRNFHPHVTLARIRNGKAPAVAQWLEQKGAFHAGPFEVGRFVLFSSRASTGGGPYVVEQEYQLAG